MAAATYLEDIRSGRYDAECAEGWPNAIRGKLAYYTKPYAFIPVVAVVRADDTRFTPENMKALNDPAITMATLDGETSQILARTRFPQAKELSLPQTVPTADQLMNVATGKADVMLTDTLTAKGFMDANPGKLKTVSYDPPIHVAALNFTLPQDDRLKNMLDVATDQLLANGTVEKILRPYMGEGLVLLPNEVAETAD
jgi:ABC-type amino acid transport substrate-binding protein